MAQPPRPLLLVASLLWKVVFQDRPKACNERYTLPIHLLLLSSGRALLVTLLASTPATAVETPIVSATFPNNRVFYKIPKIISCRTTCRVLSLDTASRREAATALQYSLWWMNIQDRIQKTFKINSCFCKHPSLCPPPTSSSSSSLQLVRYVRRIISL